MQLECVKGSLWENEGEYDSWVEWYLLDNLNWMDTTTILSLLQTKIDNAKTDTEKAYYKRMLSLLNEPNLTKVEPHPVKDIVDKIVNSPRDNRDNPLKKIEMKIVKIKK